jgi:hypothetical protein
VARVLIIGGGCRGLGLARAVAGEGHAVRIATRTETRRSAIEGLGAECWIGDPDRLGTLRGALESVTVACWLLGTAQGSQEQLGALHRSRVRSFLEHAIDTTMRGFLYEAAGTVPDAMLADGERLVQGIARRNAIPAIVLRVDPRDEREWRREALTALHTLLEGEPAR